MSHLRKTLFQFRKNGTRAAIRGFFFVHGDTIFGLPCSNPGPFLCTGLPKRKGGRRGGGRQVTDIQPFANNPLHFLRRGFHVSGSVSGVCLPPVAVCVPPGAQAPLSHRPPNAWRTGWWRRPKLRLLAIRFRKITFFRTFARFERENAPSCQDIALYAKKRSIQAASTWAKPSAGRTEGLRERMPRASS